MVIRRVDVLSLGKVLGTLYALMGLIFGALFSLFAVLGAAIGSAAGEEEAIFGLVFGAGAVVVLPLFYGLMGFLGGMLTAFFYNLAAGWVGGIVVETTP